MSKFISLDSAIQLAASSLPTGYVLRVVVERGAGWLELTAPNGDELEIPGEPKDPLGDQVEAAKAAGIDPNKVVGFNCIGRATGQGDAGIAAKNRGEPWDKGCNWTLGGLFRVHQTEVIVEDGVRRPVFEFAD